MARIAKKTKRCLSDLTDEEWDRLAPLMAKPGRRGRPREVDFREVINAVRYLVRSGCGWRMLPIHFGAWQTVYGWFRELARRFLFKTVHDIEFDLPPRWLPRFDVESAPRNEQRNEEEPFHRGAYHRDDQGAGGWFFDVGRLPQAWTEPGDVLQAESQVWRAGRVRSPAAAAARG